MPRKKRDANRAMQRHPTPAEGTVLGIQRSVLQDHSRCFIITISFANLQAGGKIQAMLQSRGQVDTAANTVKDFVALLARAAESRYRYDVWLEIKLACPLVLVARNL